MTLTELVLHLQKGGFNASYNTYLKAAQVFTAEFNGPAIAEMLRGQGFNAWAEMTGRTIGTQPQAVVYAR